MFVWCVMSDITNRICSTCRRVIDINDLSINEGKPYHDHCLLQNTRSRISFLSDKVGRRTATVLDAEELQDLLYVESRIKKDIETRVELNLINNDRPIFLGNTPLGKHSAMNPPTWKKLLARRQGLEGTKYHMHKVPELPSTTNEPIWKITIDENNHKGVIQIGTQPIQISSNKRKELPSGQTDALIVQNKDNIDYEAERININIWRGFNLLDALVPNFNLLYLNNMIASLNQERNKQNILVSV